MNDAVVDQMNSIFSCLADELNISPTKQKKAIRSYGYVGKWLEDGEVSADVYPQGSFSLGTVVRPLSGDDDGYDIDLVTSMNDLKDTSPASIKQVAGNRLAANELLSQKMNPEGKRCWTLEYDEFHMDVLPCVPDSSQANLEYGSSAIRLTHREDTGRYSNRYSNPKGYCKWFEGKMECVLNKERTRLSRILNRSVEDVKTFETRTPLQKAAQILKHHRNMMFEGKNDAPISIMITTLAAKAYRGETGTFDALCGIVSRMRSCVTNEDAHYVVRNPVDRRENFADIWVEEPLKQANFFYWLDRVEKDFGIGMIDIRGLDQIKYALEGSVGDIMATRAVASYGKTLNDSRHKNGLYVTATGLTADTTENGAPIVPNHSFYGA